MIWCTECAKATGTGGFTDRPAHDRHAVDPWNGHTVEAIDEAQLPKARWMLFCPLCMDTAASGTPEAGCETKHPTIADAPNGDEVIECTACSTRYLFNIAWTFDKKLTPPKPRAVIESPSTVFIVRAYPTADECEAYRSEQDANERVRELEEEALEANGYVKINDQMWESPCGGWRTRDGSVEQAQDEHGVDMPELAEEVEVL